MIAVIDYGMGNVHSVQKALEKCGANAVITGRPEDIAAAGKLVLPGVGAFDDAMKALDERGLTTVIKQQLSAKKPFLGICLGMQLLFETSEEASKYKGLGVLPGKVRKLPRMQDIKVPHMGWNQVSKTADTIFFQGVPEKAFVYFCHSYYPEPADTALTAAVTQYGISFASAVCKGNLYGVQFHPEKSQDTGLIMLKNFVLNVR